MQRDPSLLFYKIVLLLFVALYMWGPAWDSKFRAVVYFVLFGAMAGGVITDVGQWWQHRQNKLQEMEKLQSVLSDEV